MSEPTTPHPLAIEAAQHPDVVNAWRDWSVDEIRMRDAFQITANRIHTTALQPVIDKVERYLVAKYRIVSPYDMDARVKLVEEQEKSEADLWELINHISTSPKTATEPPRSL